MNPTKSDVTGYWFHLKVFAEKLKHESRFVIPESDMSFVNSVIQLVRDNFVSTIPESSKLYRARLNKKFEIEEKEKLPYPPDQMGAPPRHLATPGRINPEGIPYLYCAGEMTTAGSEIRPWKGAYLTVAEIEIIQDTLIVDLTIDFEYENASQALFYLYFIEMFSLPSPPSYKLNYFLTQYFSEHFKALGYRGIKYKSFFNTDGTNYALFFEEDYTIEKTYTVETCEIDFTFFEV
jgi:RES domain-containing protein